MHLERSKRSIYLYTLQVNIQLAPRERRSTHTHTHTHTTIIHTLGVNISYPPKESIFNPQKSINSVNIYPPLERVRVCHHVRTYKQFNNIRYHTVESECE